MTRRFSRLSPSMLSIKSGCLGRPACPGNLVRARDGWKPLASLSGSGRSTTGCRRSHRPATCVFGWTRPCCSSVSSSRWTRRAPLDSGRRRSSSMMRRFCPRAVPKRASRHQARVRPMDCNSRHFRNVTPSCLRRDDGRRRFSRPADRPGRKNRSFRAKLQTRFGPFPV